MNATALFGYGYSYTLSRYDGAPSTLTTGYQAPYTSSLNRFGPFKIDRGLAFANAGGVADLSSSPATQLGYYPQLGTNSSFNQIVASDTSLNRVFFLSGTSATSYSYTPDGVVAYDQTSFLPTAVLPFNMPVIEGNTSYTAIDLVRWGQDGLAALTSGGHLYIVRGPAVVPQLLNQNAAAALTSASPGNIAHGAGNTLITLTGSSFVRGAAATWNSAYRTTTWVDANHLTLAIPASDLATAGSATIVVTNPGASASGSLNFTIN
ncbi:MAG: hypothetical protein JWM43_1811 [Acidobacteriaceae bacterium]|nr:hypothetical protein [Acidobacteriaceae bacterium]